MKSVLEELYYGNIRPFANRREASEEKQKVLQKMEDYRNQILERMTPEQKHLLEISQLSFQNHNNHQNLSENLYLRCSNFHHP